MRSSHSDRDSSSGFRSSFLNLYFAIFLFALLIPVTAYYLNWNSSIRRASGITGGWIGSFHLMKPQPGASATIPCGTSGDMDIWVDSLNESDVEGMHFGGRSSVSLKEIGFGRCGGITDLGGTTTFPAPVDDPAHFVVGKTLNDDSVLFIVNPYISHGQIILRGRVRQNLIEGHWAIRGDGPGSSGRFTLRRR